MTVPDCSGKVTFAHSVPDHLMAGRSAGAACLPMDITALAKLAKCLSTASLRTCMHVPAQAESAYLEGDCTLVCRTRTSANATRAVHIFVQPVCL
jgi:hypothetical protein